MNLEFPLFSHIFLSLVILGDSDEQEGTFDHLRPIISLKLKVVGERAEKCWVSGSFFSKEAAWTVNLANRFSYGKGSDLISWCDHVSALTIGSFCEDFRFLADVNYYGEIFFFLRYLEKKLAHMSVVLGYVSLLLCGFVALSVRMCIASANEVEGTKSLCLRNNEILASKHDIAALKVKQTILVFDNFVAFYSG